MNGLTLQLTFCDYATNILNEYELRHNLKLENIEPKVFNEISNLFYKSCLQLDAHITLNAVDDLRMTTRKAVRVSKSNKLDNGSIKRTKIKPTGNGTFYFLNFGGTYLEFDDDKAKNRYAKKIMDSIKTFVDYENCIDSAIEHDKIEQNSNDACMGQFLGQLLGKLWCKTSA